MKLPTTVLGGFLGAGKTTVVNELLRRAQTRVAVLVNDFGTIDVDAKLIEATSGTLIALSNGCVCCSIGADLSVSLAQLAAMTPPPDQILIEASGVSDPWRIAQLVKLETRLALDAVVVLVDADAFPTQLADPWLTDTLERQLARADLVRLTKCDVADAATQAATKAAILRIRPGVPIFQPSDGDLFTVLFGRHHQASTSRFWAETVQHGFTSWSWIFNEPLDRGRLQEILASLPASVLRAKGFCRFDTSSDVYLLQLVGQRWTLEPWADSTIATGFIIIGTNQCPSADHLTEIFTPCVYR